MQPLVECRRWKWRACHLSAAAWARSRRLRPAAPDLRRQERRLSMRGEAGVVQPTAVPNPRCARCASAILQVAREGTKKTVFTNFMDLCKSMNRNHEHVLVREGQRVAALVACSRMWGQQRPCRGLAGGGWRQQRSTSGDPVGVGCAASCERSSTRLPAPNCASPPPPPCSAAIPACGAGHERQPGRHAAADRQGPLPAQGVRDRAAPVRAPQLLAPVIYYPA